MELEQKNKQLKDELESTKAKVTELKQVQERYTASMYQTEKQLISQRETILKQEATISSLKDDLNVSQANMSDLKAQIRALEAREPQEVEKIVYRTDADTKNKLISQQETILKQKATISSLKDDLSVSRANMSDLSEPSLIDSKLAENNAKMMLEIGRLKATNSSLRDKLEDIKKVVGNFDFNSMLQKIKEKFTPAPPQQQQKETEIFLSDEERSEWERQLKKSEQNNSRERLK